MAKKQKTQEVEVPVVETPIVKTTKPKKVEPAKPKWEIKDRIYYLKGSKKPLSYMLRSSNISMSLAASSTGLYSEYIFSL